MGDHRAEDDLMNAREKHPNLFRSIEPDGNFTPAIRT
jgi:hypothetical protein